MKKIIIVFAMLTMGSLIVSPSMVSAQGTSYLSNLSQASQFYTFSISSNGFIAQRFVTGNSPGYLLNSVQLLMDSALGAPNGFSVYLYGASRSGSPSDAPIANLGGANPIFGGIYSFTNQEITLLPSTSYFIAVHATSPPEDGGYRWRISQTNTYASSGNWQMSLNRYVSDAGGYNWSAVGDTPLQFAINSTIIPEPSSLTLLGLGTLFLSIPNIRKQLPKHALL